MPFSRRVKVTIHLKHELALEGEVPCPDECVEVSARADDVVERTTFPMADARGLEFRIPGGSNVDVHVLRLGMDVKNHAPRLQGMMDPP